MMTPLFLILIYLSCAFILGLMLGWVQWKFSKAAKTNDENTEVDFWQQRFEQARSERDIAQTKIEGLEEERATLKKRLKASDA